MNLHFSCSHERFFSSNFVLASLIIIHPVTSPRHSGHDGFVAVFVVVVVDSVNVPFDSVKVPFAIRKRCKQFEWRWSVSQTKGRHPLL